MALGKNIKHARDAQRLTLERLAELSGVDVGTINALENRDSQRSKYASAIAAGLGLTMEQLEAGFTEPPVLMRDSGGLLAKDSYTIPVFGAVASMGTGAVIQVENDAVVDHIRLTKQFVDANMRGISSPSNLAVLSAIGNSMEPTFKHGDMLIVDKGAVELKTDSIYVFERFGELFIKRIDRRFDDGAIIIKSDNPLHGESVVPSGEKDSLHVLGRVVFAWNGRQL